MESYEDIKRTWEEHKRQEIAPDPLDNRSIDSVIKSRVKRETRILMEYFWASFAYQNLMYAILVYLTVRHWGDSHILVWSFAGILFYMPFTFLLMKKFKAASRRTATSSIQDIRSNVGNQFTQLSEFFRFKRRFDWIGVPVSCFIIVLATFKLFVNGSVEDHLVTGALLYIVWLAMFLIATGAENKKRFAAPLRQLKLVLEDLKE